MHSLEQFCVRLRHAPGFNRVNWLWDALRPAYNSVIGLAGRRGLERRINGTDNVRVLPRFRETSEVYEPEVWRRVMNEVRPGDVIADVGAFVGLYTVALAKRVGEKGRVFAFEPDPENHSALRAHVELNGVGVGVHLVRAAVGNVEGRVPFAAGGASESAIGAPARSGATEVDCVRLDNFQPMPRLDILKIDVEGYEERVLQGAAALFAEDRRRPRIIFVEVHPYAWADLGTTSESLLGLLASYGYEATEPNGKPVQQIRHYGEIVATRAR
jgi:FkbM family methyltransferase